MAAAIEQRFTQSEASCARSQRNVQALCAAIRHLIRDFDATECANHFSHADSGPIRWRRIDRTEWAVPLRAATALECQEARTYAVEAG